MHVVVGTTGWDDERVETLRDQLAGAARRRRAHRPQLRDRRGADDGVRAQAARFYESVEVIELHHPDKVDAPSGTAARTADLIAPARRTPASAPCPTRPPTTPTAPAARACTASRCTRCGCAGSWRTRRCCSGTGEMLTIRHDSFDRVSFMPGVLAAVRRSPTTPALTVGLEHYLGLA